MNMIKKNKDLLAEPIYIPAPQPIVIPAPNIITTNGERDFPEGD